MVSVETAASLEQCVFTFTADSPTRRFPQAYHVMISVKGGQLRSTFVLGVQPSAGPCAPVTITPVSPVGVCP
jgi:hypothetical protein